MNASELLKIGLHRALSLAMFYQLEQRWLWAAVKGGWRYLVAIQDGEQVSAVAAQRRLTICQACDAFDTVATARTDLRASYCGQTVQTGPGATCGCLLAVTIQGKPIDPAGKLLVSGECCPRGAWHEEKPVRSDDPIAQ